MQNIYIRWKFPNSLKPKLPLQSQCKHNFANQVFINASNTEQLRVTTFVPPRLSWCVVELEVDLAVLSSLGPVLAVLRSLVGLVVDLSAECVGELFCGAAAFLTQVVTVPEVLAQVAIVAVGRQKSEHKNVSVCLHERLQKKKNATF